MPFSDSQRAQIFVRDRGICAFSGKSLWLVDYGATPFWDWDWADHIMPVSRGGRSVVENGACVASARNWARRNNTADRHYLFRHGAPTAEALYDGPVPLSVMRNLRRFARLEPSDWYFNRALGNILLWLAQRYEGHKRRTRRRAYWCGAAARRLQIWAESTKRDDYRSFEQRGLTPRKRAPDVDIMLSLRGVAEAGPCTAQQVEKVAAALYPYYAANCDCMGRFVAATTSREREAVLEEARHDQLVSALTLQTMQHNLGVLRACGR